MDGYKKGNLGHQSTTSAASYQFSAADHYSDTMICLWGFLLLAVATSSVDSYCVASMAPQSTVFKDALNSLSSAITETKLASVIKLDFLGSLLSGVNNLFSAITGLVLKSVNVTSAGIHNKTNGWEIIARMTIDVSCKEVPNFQIVVIIIAPIDLNVVNGCAQWNMSGDAINISLSIDGTTLNFGSSLLTNIQKAILPQISNALKNTVSQALNAVNQENKKLNAVFTIGNKACRYYITGVTKQGMNAVVNLTTTIENETLSWQNVGNFNLTENKTIGWNLDQRLLNKVIGVALSALNFKINIANGLLANIFWLAQNANVYIRLYKGNVTNTNVSVNGVGLNVTISYSLFSNSTIVSSGNIFLFLRGLPLYRNGSFGINFTDLSINDVSIDVLLVNAVGANCICGGGDTTRAWVTNIVISNFNSFIAYLNGILSAFLPLPAIFPIAGLIGECKAVTDGCTCTA